MRGGNFSEAYQCFQAVLENCNRILNDETSSTGARNNAEKTLDEKIEVMQAHTPADLHQLRLILTFALIARLDEDSLRNLIQRVVDSEMLTNGPASVAA